MDLLRQMVVMSNGVLPDEAFTDLLAGLKVILETKKKKQQKAQLEREEALREEASAQIAQELFLLRNTDFSEENLANELKKFTESLENNSTVVDISIIPVAPPVAPAVAPPVAPAVAPGKTYWGTQMPAPSKNAPVSVPTKATEAKAPATEAKSAPVEKFSTRELMEAFTKVSKNRMITSSPPKSFVDVDYIPVVIKINKTNQSGETVEFESVEKAGVGYILSNGYIANNKFDKSYVNSNKTTQCFKHGDLKVLIPQVDKRNGWIKIKCSNPKNLIFRMSSGSPIFIQLNCQTKNPIWSLFTLKKDNYFSNSDDCDLNDLSDCSSLFTKRSIEKFYTLGYDFERYSD